MTDEPATVGAGASGRPAGKLCPRVPPHVVHRSFPDETVVVNLRTAQYHALNESAGRMFQMLLTAEPLGVAVRRVADHYGIPAAIAERDLGRLCASLLERGLLDSAEPAQA